MKSLSQYILEATQEIFRLNSVEVTYDCHPIETVKMNRTAAETIILNAPSSWTENDIQQYLDDKFLGSLPGSDGLSDKFFGVNKDNIYDVYFQYEKFVHLEGESENVDVEFDNSFYRGSDKDMKLDCYKITNLQYVIKFEPFDLNISLTGDDNEIKSSLKKIFENTKSNSINKYPLFLDLRPSNIMFTK